jgi:hypothetical protein
MSFEFNRGVMTVKELNKLLTTKITEEKAKEIKLIEKSKYTTKKIWLTNYYIGDGSGSTTSSGLGIDDFGVNSLGWYTYKGLIVVASATYRCLAVKSCSHGKPLPSDYSIFRIYDKVSIIYKGAEYKGIVLDSCGACIYHINGELYQRYDIFISPQATRFGRVMAQVKLER